MVIEERSEIFLFLDISLKLEGVGIDRIFNVTSLL